MLRDKFKIDFVGIGAPKCATTWIYECLQEHPELCLAPKDQENLAYFLKSQPSEHEINRYKAFFNSQKCKLKGDFYVHYLSDKKAVWRMKQHNPDIKIIVCLRNPVDRLYSLFRYSRFSQRENWKSLEQMIKERPAIIGTGFYYRHLKKYLNAFSRKNILILIYEDIKNNPVSFIQRIYRFLNVDDNFVPPSVRLKINPTDFKLTILGRIFHKKIAKFLLRNSNNWAWRIKRSPLIKKMICGLAAFYPSKKDQGLSLETRLRLGERYKEDIEKIEELTNRDLSFWK